MRMDMEDFNRHHRHHRIKWAGVIDEPGLRGVAVECKDDNESHVWFLGYDPRPTVALPDGSYPELEYFAVRLR